jgi:hypothetical protein
LHIEDSRRALTAQGKLDETIVHFHAALAARPDYAEARNNLDVVLKRLEKKRAAGL